MKLQLNQIFQNGAVLAANKPIRIFGTGDGHVAVDFLGMHAEADSQNGSFCVTLPAQPYGGPYEMTVTLNGDSVILSDLYLGEVLLLAGQSNIEFRMNESKDYPELSEPCHLLRAFHPERITKNRPFHPEDGWLICETDNVIANTSAIGYEVGVALTKTLGCAVGLIAAYQGASVIQSWMPAGACERIGFRFTKEELYHSHFDYPLWNDPGQLYEAMLKPYVPYSVSTAIWYQGESNASLAESAVYHKILAEMIRIWRCDFDDPTLPFLVIQIADYAKNIARSNGWRQIQEAQIKVQDEIDHVKTIICRDVCEDDDIHPPTKRHLSARVTNAILEDMN